MDSFVDLITTLRREIPDVSPEVWGSILRVASQIYGSTTIYVQAQPKRAKLEMLEAAQQSSDVSALAAKLGVTSRRVRQLQQLRGKNPRSRG